MQVSRIATALLTVAVLFPAVTASAAPEEVVFEGSGWGHGMGMSQWGAFARALDGQTAEEIVTTYYPTSEVVDVGAVTPSWYRDDSTPVWVNMLGTSPYAALSSFQLRGSATGLYVCQQEPRSESFWSWSRNEGEISPYVLILENRLAELGFDPGEIDGSFDVDTDSAIRAFQTDKGLVVDGIVGKNTKAALWPPDSGDRCVIKTALHTSTITISADAEGNCVVPGAEAVGDCMGSVRALTPDEGIVLPQKLDASEPVQLAHGSLRIRPDLDAETGAFEGVHVVLEIGMEDYVSGIDEVMNWWAGSGAAEALGAQAIAARTFGLRNVLSYGQLGTFDSDSYPYSDNRASFRTRRDHCWCHLYSNTYSQVYNGLTRETESGGTWPSAVVATSGQVLTAPGYGVIWALYTSSNGGATEAHNDYYGYAPPSDFSYLVSVPDPYSLTTENPYAVWTASFTPGMVAAKVGMDELTGVEVTAQNESGSAKTVTFSGRVDGQPTMIDKTGGWVKSALGLRSRYFDVSWGSLQEIEDNPPEYSDIEDSIFVNDITWAAAAGITFGCNPPDNDRFCPDRSVSREEMARFMTSALDLPSASKDYFDDDDSSLFEDEINRMAEADITRGCGERKFCPEMSVDRGQMAAFLVRAFNLSDNGGGDLFVDDDNSIFENDIDRLGTAGITRGCNPPANDRFCPDLDVDRGAMMAFLHRALD